MVLACPSAPAPPPMPPSIQPYSKKELEILETYGITCMCGCLPEEGCWNARTFTYLLPHTL